MPDVKLFGPAHEYVAPPDDVKFNVFPAQSGLLEPAVAVGLAFTVTLVVLVAVQVLAFVTVTV